MAEKETAKETKYVRQWHLDDTGADTDKRTKCRLFLCEHRMPKGGEKRWLVTVII